MVRIRSYTCLILGAILTGCAALSASAQVNFAYQYGSLLNPFSGQDTATRILTFQHATGWGKGGSFFFIDLIDDDVQDGFNDKDFYGEWYPTLSLGKLFGSEIKIGPVRDVSLIGGTNFGGDANVLKFVPGVQLSWAVPGFIFLNTDFASIMDMNTGNAAPRTGDAFMFDVSWLSIFNLGSVPMRFMGHAEIIGEVSIDGGGTQESWILAQPQLVADISKLFGGAASLMVGVEFQYWSNKLGVADQSEAVPQLLIVWEM